MILESKMNIFSRITLFQYYNMVLESNELYSRITPCQYYIMVLESNELYSRITSFQYYIPVLESVMSYILGILRASTISWHWRVK